MENSCDFTIIVPVYNEAENLPRVEKDLLSFLHQSNLVSKILFVDDGSTDQSPEIIESICANHDDFNYIRLKGNHGLSTALKAGFDHCNSRLIGYLDADLQTSPDDFIKLLPFTENYDLITGIRIDRKDNPVKKISSSIANAIRRSVTHDGISDTGCPLKIIRSDIVRRIPFFDGMHRFLPALVLLAGGTVKQIPVRHFPRKAGKSKYHLWNRLAGPLTDLIAFSWMRRNYINYEIIKQG